MLSRLARAVEQVNAAVGEFQFSAYAQTLYDLLWRDFCDWYLEAIKPTAKDNPAQRAVLGGVLGSILRLLHPISPFITEAIHERMADVPTGSIEGLTLASPSADGLLCTAGWPEVDPSLRDDAIDARFERVRTLVSAIREVRSQHQVKPRRRVVLHCPNDKQLKAVASAEGLIEHLAGLARATTDEPASASVAFTVDSVEYRLSELADAVDAGAERARLEKQIAELDKSIRTLEGRLNNPGYTEKAPPHMVQQTRDQLQDKMRERQAAAAALEQLR
jgi:valyl-tRNA synthetase